LLNRKNKFIDYYWRFLFQAKVFGHLDMSKNGEAYDRFLIKHKDIDDSEVIKRKFSEFEILTAEILPKMYPGLILIPEYYPDGFAAVDLYAPDHNLCIQVNGPHHFTNMLSKRASNNYNVGMIARHNLLTRQGYNVHNINLNNYFSFSQDRRPSFEDFLRKNSIKLLDEFYAKKDKKP